MSQLLAAGRGVAVEPDLPAATAGGARVDGVRVALVVLVSLWAVWLALMSQAEWLTGEVRNHVSTDFSAFWAAARMALTGEAAAVYDEIRHGAVIREALGPVKRAHEYLNPPTFLLVVAPLGWLGYVAAKLAWLAATLAAFLAVAYRIVPHPKTILVALALPIVFHNFVSGQNGLLMAALVGAALVWLPTRPWLAGALIGCLAVKPQIGLVFPLILLASGNWRAFAGAALSVAGLVALSALAFGPEPWLAFWHSLAGTGEAVLVEGRTGWGKMQSLLGLLRHLGIPAPAAWALQIAWSIGVAAGLCIVWRRPLPHDLKAAAAAVAVVLLQPYVFIYDEALLGVALAFLARAGWSDGLLPSETLRIGLAMLALAATMFLVHNLGFVAALLVASVVVGRIAQASRDLPSRSGPAPASA